MDADNIRNFVREVKDYLIDLTEIADKLDELETDYEQIKSNIPELE